MRLRVPALPVAVKLPLGLGVLVVLIVAMAVVGRFGLSTTLSGLQSFESAAAKAMIISRIEAEVNSLQGSTTIFAMQGGEQAQIDARAGIDRTDAVVKELAALPEAEAAALAARYRAPIERYRDSLAKLVEARGMRDLLFRNEINRNHGTITDILAVGVEETAMGGNFVDALDLSSIRDRYMRGMGALTTYMAEPTPALKDDAVKSFNAAKFDAEQLAAASRNKEAKDAARRVATRLVSHAEAIGQLFPLVEEASSLLSGGVTPAIAEIDQISRDALASARQAMDRARAEAEAAGGNVTWMLTVMATLAGALGVLVAVAVVRGVVPPVRGLTRAMTAFAAGDWSLKVPGTDKRDEIGDMARAVLVFKENGLAHEALKSESEREQEARFRRQQALEAAVAGFEQVAAEVVNAVGQAATELDSAARSMTSTAEEASHQAGSVAAASEQASVNVQSLADAGERLSAAIGEISAQVASSSRIGGAAVQEAAALDAQLRALAEAGDRIVSVVSIINGLADQTNLLALNATIEAARAGEAGRGFAVVASEVKALAGQTAKATGEIGAIVAGIRDVTDQTIAAVQGMTRTIADMDRISTAISAAVEEQSITTREMAGNVRETARGAEEVSANIAGVRQASEATGAASMQVLSSSEDLSRQAARLRSEIDVFLDRVRAA